jgi:hypothetical protein
MESSADLDQLSGVRVPYADYLAARGRTVQVTALDAGGGVHPGELREVGGLLRPGPGFEAFWLQFAIRDAVPAQGLYRIEIDGLPPHALLLVPSARRGDVTDYHASFNREQT